MTGFRWYAIVTLLAVLAASPLAAAEPPLRIISLNLCTDQLLLALADQSTIASVTNLARDCTISAYCREAATVPINYGTAEEMVAVQPDLVLAGRYTTRPAVGIAHSLGMRVIDLDPANSLDNVRAQIHQVANALGQPERGAAMIADLDDRSRRGSSGNRVFGGVCSRATGRPGVYRRLGSPAPSSCRPTWMTLSSISCGAIFGTPRQAGAAVRLARSPNSPAILTKQPSYPRMVCPS